MHTQEPCICGGHGWRHMREPFEIQRCDDCGSLKDDDDARRAHRKECGCHWPEIDFQALLLSWLSDAGKVPASLEIRLESAKGLISDRTDLRENMWLRVHTLLDMVGNIMNCYFFLEDIQSGMWDEKFLRAMRGTSGVCAQLIAMANSHTWNNNWLRKPEDGIVQDGKWYILS